MWSALKTYVFLALCQPANADLNLAADYVFLFIYMDKLHISPKIVWCDMIKNLGGQRGALLKKHIFWIPIWIINFVYYVKLIMHMKC